ncbi:hypothetical protein KK470_29430, partial [Klebsiella pneumoniae]|uniref:hypothetical protein n=1 Tax=Klebsiella pneumoniae TaxID=573 RepID=UPI001BE01E5F
GMKNCSLFCNGVRKAKNKCVKLNLHGFVKLLEPRMNFKTSCASVFHTMKVSEVLMSWFLGAFCVSGVILGAYDET